MIYHIEINATRGPLNQGVINARVSRQISANGSSKSKWKYQIFVIITKVKQPSASQLLISGKAMHFGEINRWLIRALASWPRLWYAWSIYQLPSYSYICPTGGTKKGRRKKPLCKTHSWKLKGKRYRTKGLEEQASLLNYYIPLCKQIRSRTS